MSEDVAGAEFLGAAACANVSVNDAEFNVCGALTTCFEQSGANLADIAATQLGVAGLDEGALRVELRDAEGSAATLSGETATRTGQLAAFADASATASTLTPEAFGFSSGDPGYAALRVQLGFLRGNLSLIGGSLQTVLQPAVQCAPPHQQRHRVRRGRRAIWPYPLPLPPFGAYLHPRSNLVFVLQCQEPGRRL